MLVQGGANGRSAHVRKEDHGPVVDRAIRGTHVRWPVENGLVVQRWFHHHNGLVLEMVTT